MKAEVAAKSEEITKLTSEINILREELAVAKENSVGLVESLDKASRELSESRDKGDIQHSVQAQLDAKNTEIQLLTQKLEQTQSQLKILEINSEDEKSKAASAIQERDAKFAAFGDKNAELDAELKKLGEAKSELELKVQNLTSEIDSIKKSKSESEAKV